MGTVDLNQIVGHGVDLFLGPKRASSYHPVKGSFPGSAILLEISPHGLTMTLKTLVPEQPCPR